MSWKTPVLGLLGLALVAAAATANESGNLRIGMQVEREVAKRNDSGQLELRTEPVAAASRGDVLVYTLNIVNEGGDPALAARVDDPIPAGTVLIPDSAGGTGTRITYSIDGGKTYVVYPALRRVVGEDGVARDLPVPAEDYTHVRWTLTEALDPGQVRTAYFKVRVE
jgi:uncharacterized repeat protein (TIGR01451 family)